MQFVKLSLIFLTFILSLALLGCDGQSKSTNKKGPAPQKSDPSRPPVNVGFIELELESINRTDQLPGRIVSYQVAEIRPQVSGIIQSRLFEEGSYVEAGQQLYQIDPAIYEAEHAMARATLTNAEARKDNALTLFNRYEKLIENSAISQQQYDDAASSLDQAQAAVAMAEADVKMAGIRLEYTKVHSPISGYISPSGVTKGALVTALQTMPLATVRQLDPVYVDLAQAASEARELQQRLNASKKENKQKNELPVTLHLGNSGETYPHKGTLDATDLAVDLQTGAIRLRSVFPNPDKILLPGMFVRASIEDVGQTNEIVVPQKSVGIGPSGEKTVWVIGSGDKAEKRSISAGAAYKNNWVIIDGLEVGDRLIVEGTMKLREGTVLQPEKINSEN